MKSAQQILFPEVVLKVRIRFKIHTVVLRPLSIRQTRDGLADALETCTGLSRRQLRKLLPATIADLSNRVNMINAWSPQELAKELEKEAPSDKPAASLEDLAAELIAAGHDAFRIWDLTPEQFCFYLREARRARTRAELLLKKSFTEAACAAVGTLSKEGAKHAHQLITSLEKSLKELAPKS